MIKTSPSTTQHMYKKQKIGTRGSFPLRPKTSDPVKPADGLHPRFAHMHIGGLIQQNTLHKAPNKNNEPKLLARCPYKNRYYYALPLEPNSWILATTVLTIAA